MPVTSFSTQVIGQVEKALNAILGWLLTGTGPDLAGNPDRGAGREMVAP